MSNTKHIRITGDVPFNWLGQGGEAAGNYLDDEDIAVVGSILLSPSTGLSYEYLDAGWRTHENDNGVTSMYRLVIDGQEALPWPLLQRLVRIIAKAGPYAKVHIAEAMDMDDRTAGYVWEHIVPPAELSGEAGRRADPRNARSQVTTFRSARCRGRTVRDPL